MSPNGQPLLIGQITLRQFDGGQFQITAEPKDNPGLLIDMLAFAIKNLAGTIPRPEPCAVEIAAGPLPPFRPR